MSDQAFRGRAWHNGSPRRSGSGYGIAFSLADRDVHFDREWTAVSLRLEGGPTVDVSLTPSFWRTCSELRSAEIGRWMIGLGLAPWTSGHPPAMNLIPVGESSFVVRTAQDR